MKLKSKASSFLIQYSAGKGSSSPVQSKMWDGQSLLTLGHPTRFILQRKENHILVRDFSKRDQSKSPLVKIELTKSNFGKLLSLSGSAVDHIRLSPLTAMAAVNTAQVSQIKAVSLPTTNVLTPEDKLFNKYLKHLLAATAVALALILILKPSDPPTANEELIPKKYAKLILTKPKETQHNATAASAAASQAQVKAVARAMQSKTVQKSISSILKGGISKYSIMATGKSIQNLSQKIQGTTALTGASLQNKASDLLAGSHVGSAQIGSDDGYGAGHGTSVKGQGVGQIEIGLNTQDATVDEGLTKEEVARVIHAHLSEIRYCYESAILKDPTLAGKVLIDFKINPTGMVGASNVSEQTLTDRNVGSCLMGKLRSWKFPQPRGGVTVAVSYPFIFKSLSR